jgi:hypothetical protein
LAGKGLPLPGNGAIGSLFFKMIDQFRPFLRAKSTLVGEVSPTGVFRVFSNCVILAGLQEGWQPCSTV